MSNKNPGDPFVFPEWHNKVPKLVFGIIGPLATVLGIGAATYYLSPEFYEVGYEPDQPVEYSHELHAGELGIDCRYCHSEVENGRYAGVPPTQTCMNCHTEIRKDSPKLAKVRESWETGKPIEWIRVHKTPDYAYFDHSAHVNSGVGCESCHGRIDQQVVVKLTEPLSMGWCLDCHREPGSYLRPQSEITTMGYEPDTIQWRVGQQLVEEHGINPPIHCSGCHR